MLTKFAADLTTNYGVAATGVYSLLRMGCLQLHCASPTHPARASDAYYQRTSWNFCLSARLQNHVPNGLLGFFLGFHESPSIPFVVWTSDWPCGLIGINSFHVPFLRVLVKVEEALDCFASEP